MTTDIKYPEELSQAEVLKNLERLQTKLRQREEREMGKYKWEKISEEIKAEEGLRVKWVSVKDRLPVRDAPYLVFIPTADDSKPLTLIAWYNPRGCGWSGIVEYWVRAITHWMELPDWPEDYKKEEKP